jgi:hypothetical protein
MPCDQRLEDDGRHHTLHRDVVQPSWEEMTQPSLHVSICASKVKWDWRYPEEVASFRASSPAVLTTCPIAWIPTAFDLSLAASGTLYHQDTNPKIAQEPEEDWMCLPLPQSCGDSASLPPEYPVRVLVPVDAQDEQLGLTSSADGLHMTGEMETHAHPNDELVWESDDCGVDPIREDRSSCAAW